MPGKVDLKEDVFTLQADERIEVGYCAMFVKKKLMYAGPIRRSPEPDTGWVVFLHPDDFESIDEHYRKGMN